MMPYSAGTRAPGSLSATGSSPARRKSASNFRWNNGSHFASAMRKGDAEFTRFEHEGWERVADKYDSVWSSVTRQFIPHLINAVGVSTGMSVLDVACGPGYVSTAVKKLGANPTGIDFSRKMVAIARSMFPEITFREGDAQQLPFTEASFDRVL